MKHSDKIIVLFAIIVSVMIIGEVITVHPPSYFDSNVYSDENGTHYEVNAQGATNFTIIESNPGSFRAPSNIVVYYDETYGAHVEYPNSTNVLQMVKELSIRGMNASIVNAIEVAEIMSEGNTDTGIIFLTGALPDTIFTGLDNDLVFKWLEVGGSIYWIGKPIGMNIATSDHRTEKIDCQRMFFEDYRTEFEKNLADIPTECGEMLCIRTTWATYGLQVDLPNSLSVGFETDNGYGSIVLSKCRNGMVTVVGCDYSDIVRADIAQIVASGLTYDSSIIEVKNVYVHNGSSTGDLTGSSTCVYIFSGGYYTNYGCRYILKN